MERPNLHVIAPFHGRLDSEWGHCAFSQKSFKMAGMMQPFGYKVFEYANAGSQSACENKVALTTEAEYARNYPKRDKTAFHGTDAIYGTKAWAMFDGRLREKLAENAKPGDLVLHPFGHAHKTLPKDFPQFVHVESGIGYTDHPFGCRCRIFESSAWMHWHMGKWEDGHKDDPGMSKTYSFAVPNSFDLNEWPFSPECQNEDYVIFLGRITETKGTIAIANVVREWARLVKEGIEKPIRFVFAGQGDFQSAFMQHLVMDPAPDPAHYLVDYVGPVTGIARAKLVGHARCFLVSSTFIEPFCGAAVEAMLTGTPAIGPTFGAFTETISEGVSGFRCRTLGDYIAAIRACKGLDREKVSRRTRDRYSFETVGQLYDETFQEISDLNRKGWYTSESYRINPTDYGQTPGICGRGISDIQKGGDSGRPSGSDPSLEDKGNQQSGTQGEPAPQQS